MKRAVLAAVAIALTMLMSSARAGDQPEAVISKMTERVLAEAGQSGGQADAAKIRNLVENVILPNVDFQAMTSRAVGLKWRSATEDQRSQLMSGFQSLLVKTYAGAFTQANGASYRVGRVTPIDAETTEIRGEIVAPASSQPIAMVYRMALENGSWKVVDVSVAGDWLVAAYRSQFAQVLQNGNVDSLIRALQEKAGKKATT